MLDGVYCSSAGEPVFHETRAPEALEAADDALDKAMPELIASPTTVAQMAAMMNYVRECEVGPADVDAFIHKLVRAPVFAA